MKSFLVDTVASQSEIKMTCWCKESGIFRITIPRSLPKLYIFLTEEAYEDPEYELKLDTYFGRNCGVSLTRPFKVKTKAFLDLERDVFVPSMRCCVVRYRGVYTRSAKIFEYIVHVEAPCADPVEHFLISTGIGGWFLVDEEDLVCKGETFELEGAAAKNIIPSEGPFPDIRVSYMQDASGDLHVGYRCGALDVEPLARQLCHDIRDFEKPFEDFELFVRERRLLEIAQRIRDLTSMPFRFVGSPMKRVEWMILKRLKNLGIVTRSRTSRCDSLLLHGGMVIDPLIGYHLNVRVVEFDFFAYYPSICVAYEIDIADGRVLPLVLEEALRRRREETDPCVKAAIKLCSNAVYGVMANPHCRFFCIRVAREITRRGRENLTSAITAASRYGKVVYGDTDSFFLMGDFDVDRVLEDVHAVIKSPIRLEMEKDYASIIIVTKKNYLGMTREGQKVIKMNFLKRKDYAPFNLGIAAQIADIVLSIEGWDDVWALLQQAAVSYDHPLEPRDFVMVKKMDSFAERTAPHVVAARKLGGKPQLGYVAYFHTEEGPTPRSLWRDGVDRIDVLFYKKQLCSIMDQLLATRPGYDSDAVRQILMPRVKHPAAVDVVGDPYVHRGTTAIRCSACDTRFLSVGMRELQKRAERVPHQCLRKDDVTNLVDLWCGACQHVAKVPLPQLLDFEIEYTAFQYRECVSCADLVVRVLLTVLSSKSRRITSN